MKHLLSTKKISKEWVDRILNYSFSKDLQGRTMATLFFEPSTRTRLSFEQAITKEKGSFSSIFSPQEDSSLSKGESFYDMIKTLDELRFDFIVIRHSFPKFGLFELWDDDFPGISASIINAGDGSNEHPSQSILDLYTIKQRFGDNRVKIALCGDLEHSRTVHSLIPLLEMYEHEIILYPDRRFKLNSNHKTVNDEEFLDILPSIDVLYMTRIQSERHPLATAGIKSFSQVRPHFILDKKSINRMKKGSIVMHPLPRNDEINPEVDVDCRCVYFDQVYNGLVVRQQILHSLTK